MSRVRFLHLTTIAVLLLTLSPAVAQEQQQQQRAPIAGGPGTRLSVGCSATCEIQQNPKRELRAPRPELPLVARHQLQELSSAKTAPALRRAIVELLPQAVRQLRRSEPETWPYRAAGSGRRPRRRLGRGHSSWLNRANRRAKRRMSCREASAREASYLCASLKHPGWVALPPQRAEPPRRKTTSHRSQLG